MPLLHRLFSAQLALLLVAAFAAPSGVLCVADDGHVAFKERAGSCSHPRSHGASDRRHHDHRDGHEHHHGHEHDRGHVHEHARVQALGPAPAAAVPQHEHRGHGCHPCVDVTLVEAPPAAAAPSLDLAAPAPLLAAPLPGPELFAGGPPTFLRRHLPLPRPPLLLRSLRTVVLTC